MRRKSIRLLTLTAALAGLSGAAAAATSPAIAGTPDANETNANQSSRIAKGEPNVFMSIGNNLLGLVVTKAADGTVVADHYSHSSHSSHSSHRSHYSAVI